MYHSNFSEMRVNIIFYHNWGISLALIGRELFDKSDNHGNDVMVALFSEKIQRKLGKWTS